MLKALLLALCLAISTPAFSAAAMLVASRDLQGPFAETVIYITKYSNGHIGVILNKPSGVKLTEVLPEKSRVKEIKNEVYVGGPFRMNRLFALVKSDIKFDDGINFDEDIWMIGSDESIDKQLEINPSAARFFIGFVKWDPGELEQELSRGFFILMKPDSSILFLEDTSKLYEKLVPKGHRRLPSQNDMSVNLDS